MTSNKANILHWNAEDDGAQSTYALCSMVTDTNSGFESIANGMGNSGGGAAPADCYGPFTLTAAEASDTLSYLEFWDNWNVEDEMGVHAIEAMEQQIATALTPAYTASKSICVPSSTRACPAPYSSLGPLVSNTGLCLSYGNAGGLLGTMDNLDTEPCSWLSASQTWQTADMGQTASLGLGNQSLCIEVDGWDDFGGTGGALDHAACSGSPGEQFVVTSANELRWAMDQTMCLTASTPVERAATVSVGAPELQKCDGQPHQQWSRAWPGYSLPPPPPPVHILL